MKYYAKQYGSSCWSEVDAVSPLAAARLFCEVQYLGIEDAQIIVVREDGGADMTFRMEAEVTWNGVETRDYP